MLPGCTQCYTYYLYLTHTIVLSSCTQCCMLLFISDTYNCVRQVVPSAVCFYLYLTHTIMFASLYPVLYPFIYIWHIQLCSPCCSQCRMLFWLWWCQCSVLWDILLIDILLIKFRSLLRWEMMKMQTFLEECYICFFHLRAYFSCAWQSQNQFPLPLDHAPF